jgi:dTDP-4-amino-4,6-dideoxygalactose transaminase/RimJ/RimL family protein N-acetyltransferase
VRLRPCAHADTELLFGWRNDPFIVARGSLNRTVTWEEHRRWVAESLRAPEQRRLFIIENEGEPIGQVRFDRESDRSCAISVYLLERFTHRGLGTAAIAAGCRAIFRDWPVDEILARVRHDNPAGRASFTKTGFELRNSEVAQHDELVRGRGPDDPRRRIVPHNRLTHDHQEEEAVARCAASGRWAMGPMVERLESELSALAGGRHALMVSSGLAALRLALRAVGVKAGDRVLVPAYSCVALPNAVLAVGALPIAVDIDAHYNLDEEAGRRAVDTHRPKAAILVHTFGAKAPVEAARSWGIPIVEDCAHGFGAEGMGALGDITILSLYATKLIGAGEGGAILTSSSETAEWLRNERDYTDRAPSGQRSNDKPTELAAALALCQLKKLPELLARRRELAAQYRERLSSLEVKEDRAIWYRYTIELRNRKVTDVVRELEPHGVCATEPVSDWRSDPAEHPRATHAYQRVLSLPLYPTLSDGEQDQVIAAVLEVLK